MPARWVVVGSSVVFLVWLATAGSWPLPVWLVDAGLFAGLGLGTAAIQWVAARRTPVHRDRLAWYLLASASLLRVSAAAIWRVYSLSGTPPVWASWLLYLRVIPELAAYVTFVGSRRERAGDVRFRLDVATIVVGVVIVGWSASVGPMYTLFVRHGITFSGLLATVGGVASILLAALLYLRRADAPLRNAALCMTLANVMQIIPDVGAGDGPALVYVAGTWFTLWWWAIWQLKWYGARLALDADHTPRVDQARYRSGVMPYLFLAGANVVLALVISGESKEAGVWLIAGTSLLTGSLVLRQAIELREHGLLRRRRRDDEERFSALVQHSYDVVFLMRSDGSAMYMSPATGRLITDPSGFARPGGVVEAVHPEDRAALRRALSAPALSSENLRCRLAAADGTWRMLALRLQDLRDDPLVGAIVVHGHDVTREAVLARRLREATEVEALGIFAGGVAHDLNNVLAAISTHVELLVDEVPPDSATAREFAAMRGATHRAALLTRNLLTLSRRKSPLFESVDLVELLVARGSADVTTSVSRRPRPARINQTVLVHALDAVLARETTTGAPLGPWQVMIGEAELSAASAHALGLEAGVYATLDCRAELMRASADGAVTTGIVDDEDINVLVARAVLREMGGTLWFAPTPGGRRLTLYVPSVALP